MWLPRGGGLELACLFLEPLLWAKCCARAWGPGPPGLVGKLQTSSHSVVIVVLREVYVKWVRALRLQQVLSIVETSEPLAGM